MKVWEIVEIGPKFLYLEKEKNNVRKTDAEENKKKSQSEDKTK